MIWDCFLGGSVGFCCFDLVASDIFSCFLVGLLVVFRCFFCFFLVLSKASRSDSTRGCLLIPNDQRYKSLWNFPRLSKFKGKCNAALTC